MSPVSPPPRPLDPKLANNAALPDEAESGESVRKRLSLSTSLRLDVSVCPSSSSSPCSLSQSPSTSLKMVRAGFEARKMSQYGGSSWLGLNWNTGLVSGEDAGLEETRGEFGGVLGRGKIKLQGRFGAAVSGFKGVDGVLGSKPRSQLRGSYTDAEIPRSCRRRTRPREVLVVRVESRRLVEDSARDRERESRRGVQLGV